MSEGVAKDFGTPKELLDDENSIFCQLTKKLSPSEKKYINNTANSLDTKKLTTKRIEITECKSNKELLNDKLKNDQNVEKFTYVNEGADLNDDDKDIRDVESNEIDTTKTKYIKTNVEIIKESKSDLNIKFARYSTINAPIQIELNPKDLLDDEIHIKSIRL